MFENVAAECRGDRERVELDGELGRFTTPYPAPSAIAYRSTVQAYLIE